MKKTARVIVTYKCNRSCPGCCNVHGNAIRKIGSINELLEYEEVVITGGEPMLLGWKLLDFIRKLRRIGFSGKIYMYSAWWSKKIHDIHILQCVDGITYTLHSEMNDDDISRYKELSDILWAIDSLDNRLFVDERTWDRFHASENRRTRPWKEVRKLEWKAECNPAPNEELVEFLL